MNIYTGGQDILTDGGRGVGYSRQLLSTYYLDRQSDKEYVARADSDTAFITPVVPHMLFDHKTGKPVMYGYNDVFSREWCAGECLCVCLWG